MFHPSGDSYFLCKRTRGAFNTGNTSLQRYLILADVGIYLLALSMSQFLSTESITLYECCVQQFSGALDNIVQLDGEVSDNDQLFLSVPVYLEGI